MKQGWQGAGGLPEMAGGAAFALDLFGAEGGSMKAPNGAGGLPEMAGGTAFALELFGQGNAAMQGAGVQQNGHGAGENVAAIGAEQDGINGLVETAGERLPSGAAANGEFSQTDAANGLGAAAANGLPGADAAEDELAQAGIRAGELAQADAEAGKANGADVPNGQAGEAFRDGAEAGEAEALLREMRAQYGLPEAGAAEKLLAGLKALLGMPDAEEALLTERLQAVFEAEGYHALFGKTQGYYGPYVWRETVPTAYQVELPNGTAEYTVNILKGFVFRSWMDYLTFGRFGTGGWASPDGTINCIEQAYDFESERFLVSLLKHEAQHTVDMKQFPGITPAELEYRAKLVELHYSGNLGLLQKFLPEADESRTGDSHAMASARIKREFADTDQRSLSCVQARALELLHAHTDEMEEKYGKQKAVSGG